MAAPSVIFPLQTIPSATVILIKNGKVGAFFRSKTKVLRNRWGTPGGKFEKDATGLPQLAVDVAADELEQEVGIDVRNQKDRLQFLYAVPECSDIGIFICHVFFLYLGDGEVPENREPEKHDDLIFDTVENHLKRENLLPSLEMALRHLQGHPEMLAA